MFSLYTLKILWALRTGTYMVSNTVPLADGTLDLFANIFKMRVRIILKYAMQVLLKAEICT